MDQQMNPLGQEIDGYRILGMLGRGAMGVVYKVEHIRLKKLRALKTINLELGWDMEFQRRFDGEARMLADVDSPHIVTIHDFRHNERLGPYIVMEYVGGGSLTDLIRKEGPTPWQHALPIIKQVLAALEDAHRVGVIHRDIKPGNILLTPEGKVKVTDFGVAKALAEDDDRTVKLGADTIAGTIVGTPAYMAPEQQFGGGVDRRSDLYALGMTMYEMLAGQPPGKMAEGKAAPPHIPEGLARIIKKATERDPAKRYQSAREMRRALEAFEQEQAGDRITVESGPPAARAGSRYLWFCAAGVLLAVLALAALLMYWPRPKLPTPQPSVATLTIRTTPPGAKVSLDGIDIGVTPIQMHEVRGDRAALQLKVSMEGYHPVDSIIHLERGQHVTAQLKLRQETPLLPLPELATLQVTSDPSGAEVWISGKRAGHTPYTGEQMKPGTYRVGLRMDGYQEWSDSISVRGGEKRTISERLVLLPSPSTRKGTLVLKAVPQGPVFVDGQSASGSREVAEGMHTVRCGEGEYSSEKRVQVPAGASQEVTCYFESTINIVSNPGAAYIWINDEPTGKQTPLEMSRGPGKYRITVRKDGLEQDTTLVLRPTFEKKTYPVSLRKLNNQ